ncbi:MAG: hypothetical protein RR777_00730 [Christensenellaceae bacterium]
MSKIKWKTDLPIYIMLCGWASLSFLWKSAISRLIISKFECGVFLRRLYWVLILSIYCRKADSV